MPARVITCTSWKECARIPAEHVEELEFSRHERVFTLIGTSRALSKHTATWRRQLPGNANPETRKQSAAARLCAVAAIAGASMRYVWRMELRTRAPGYEQTRGMFTVGEATNREFPAAGGQRPGRVKLGSSEGSGGPEGVETPQTFHMSLRTPSGSLVGARTRRTEVARFKTARAEIPGGGKGLYSNFKLTLNGQSRHLDGAGICTVHSFFCRRRGVACLEPASSMAIAQSQ